MLRLLDRYQVLIAFAVILTLLAAWHLKYLLVTLFGSYVLAASMLIPTEWITKRGVPRPGAILISYGGALLILASLLTLVIAPASNDIARFVGTLPTYLNQFTTMIERLGFGSIDTANLVTAIQTEIVRITTGFASAVSGLALALIVSIYLVSDWERIHKALSELAPKKQQSTLNCFFERSRHSIASWVRGQLILSFLIGALSYVGLLLLGIPFASVLAIFAALLEFIPVIGAVIAALPALIVAFSISPLEALFVLILYTAIQQVEGQLLAPLVMKRAVSLHPIVIIFAILVGFQVLGIVGALLAVPFFAVLWVAVSMWRSRAKSVPS
ncbi:AI-2E family transporter [Patescibacteria group bacterium]|nr:AI-2E family transporter [Patescibacteria group bacterium]